MTILSKAGKPDNFESPNSIKLSFALQIFEAFIRILLNVNLSLNQTFKTNLADSIDSGNFSIRGYLPLIQKDSSTHIDGLAVYVKEDFLLHRAYLYKTL